MYTSGSQGAFSFGSYTILKSPEDMLTAIQGWCQKAHEGGFEFQTMHVANATLLPKDRLICSHWALGEDSRTTAGFATLSAEQLTEAVSGNVRAICADYVLSMADRSLVARRKCRGSATRAG